MAVRRKNPAAVALGRRGGRKGGPARAAKLTPEQRSQSARNAVQARWAKAKGGERIRLGVEAYSEASPATAAADASDNALLALLKRIKATDDATEIRRLSDRLEHVIFHKQFENA